MAPREGSLPALALAQRERDRQRTLQRVRELSQVSSTPVINPHRAMSYTAGPERSRRSKESKEERRRRKERRREERRREKKRRDDRDAATSREADRMTSNAIRHTPIMAGAKAKPKIDEIKSRQQRIPLPQRQPQPRQAGGSLDIDFLEDIFQRTNIRERDRERRREEQRQPQEARQRADRNHQLPINDIEDPVEQYQRIAAATLPPRRTTQVVSSLPSYDHQQERTRATTATTAVNRTENDRRSALLRAKGPVRGTAHPGEPRQHPRFPPPFHNFLSRNSIMPKPSRGPSNPKCKRCHGLHYMHCSGPPNCTNCVAARMECVPMNSPTHPRQQQPPLPNHDESSSPTPSPPPTSPDITPPKKKIPLNKILNPSSTTIIIYTVLRTPKSIPHPQPSPQIRMGEHFSLALANRYAYEGLHRPKKGVIGRRYGFTGMGTTGYTGGGGEEEDTFSSGVFEGEISYFGGEKEMWWVVKEEKNMMGLEKRKGKVMVDEEKVGVYKRGRWDVWVVVGRMIPGLGEGKKGEGMGDEEGRMDVDEEGQHAREENMGEEGAIMLDDGEDQHARDENKGEEVLHNSNGDEEEEIMEVDGENEAVKGGIEAEKRESMDIDEEDHQNGDEEEQIMDNDGQDQHAGDGNRGEEAQHIHGENGDAEDGNNDMHVGDEDEDENQRIEKTGEKGGDMQVDEEDEVVTGEFEAEKGESMDFDGNVDHASNDQEAQTGDITHISDDEDEVDEASSAENDHISLDKQTKSPMGWAERIQTLRELNPFYSPIPQNHTHTDSEEEEIDDNDDEQDSPNLDPSRPLSEQIEWDFTLHNSYTTASEANKAAFNKFLEVGKPRTNASKAVKHFFDLNCQDLKAQFKDVRAFEPGADTGMQFNWQPPAEYLRFYNFLVLMIQVQHTELQGPVELSGIVMKDDDDWMRRRRFKKRGEGKVGQEAGEEENEEEGESEEEDEEDEDINMSEENWRTVMVLRRELEAVMSCLRIFCLTRSD
ncbi:hypothetical protein QBC38DRAFT_468148 [Podospora fimiseda]|uniref:Uncharacterized protein n=1 Tax=Podospora fimiseda TaxID=252190 RepID=A0AAN7BXQ9_9PEZI|nr:hypothetical protein QBC38DRAFT_468148 [Podospora fimiseda]